jgi:protein-tyrosine phosphatase
MSDSRVAVLFVCLGNICRSPTAHGVFEQVLAEQGHAAWVSVDSCGTGDWHVGEAPDRRATAEARRRGYALDHLRARQVRPDDFRAFDYILAMDRANLRALEAMKPRDFDGHLGLFLEFHPDTMIAEVPDPYFGGDEGFTQVLDLIETASQGLLRALVDAR